MVKKGGELVQFPKPRQSLGVEKHSVKDGRRDIYKKV